MPILVQVAMGEREYVEVYGGDWRTADGTGKRDYLHVCDLASGHLNALRRLQDDEKMAGRQEISNNCGEDGGDDNNCLIYNLGAGRSYSVLELIHGMEKASGRKISYKVRVGVR